MRAVAFLGVGQCSHSALVGLDRQESRSKFKDYPLQPEVEIQLGELALRDVKL